MKIFNKIAIIGVGLIGGSIGRGIRKKGLAKEVLGVFRHSSTLKKALKYKAIDKGTMHIKNGVKDADLIILAAPVYSIPPLAREALKYAKAGAIITDVGSTKSWIVKEIERMAIASGSVFFVGSHPMAGSEHAGVEFAKEDLLEEASCIVTKTVNTNAKALKRVVKFWTSMGAKVKIMSPAAHDRSVSLISHLPHIVAFGLAGAVPIKDLPFAAEGFKDTTRIASSDPHLWADIFLTNQKEIIRAVGVFEKYYGDIIKAISKGDYSETVRLLKAAKCKRDKFIHGKES